MSADGLMTLDDEKNATLEAAGHLSSATETAATSDCYSLTHIATTEQLLTDLGGYVIALWSVVGLEVLLLYGLLIHTVWLVYRDRGTPKSWRAGIIWANSVHSFVALLCLGSLIVPASDNLLRAVKVIYISIVLSKFVNLSLLWFGGESELLASVGAIDMPLASPPLCCCCRTCCPRRTITKRSIRVIKLMIYQLPFSQSTYFVFALYLYSAGVLHVGEINDNPVSSALGILNAASFLLGMYGLSMFEMLTKGQLKSTHYQAKFAVIKFTVVIIKVQEFIFTIVISSGGVSCTDSMSPRVYGAFIEQIVIAAEMLVLGLLSHWVYRRDEKRQADGRPPDQPQGVTADTAERV